VEVGEDDELLVQFLGKFNKSRIMSGGGGGVSKEVYLGRWV